ncbi:MAG: NAD(P)-dependent oxidoreductase [Sphingobium sp.]
MARSIALDGAWLDSGVWLSPASERYGDILVNAHGLRWVQSAGSGVDTPLLRRLAQAGVAISRTEVQSKSIAEFVLARVLGVFQHEQERHRLQSLRTWQALDFREIRGSRWLIVGFGAIGRDVATLARSFGAEIVGMRRNRSTDPLAHRMAHPDALLDELAIADVVILSVPLTPPTASMMNKAAFDAMQPESILVNVGRGGLVDENALIDALDCGKLNHAILDVAAQEPLPRESPLWTHPRISITAHASAYGHGLRDRAESFALANILRFMTGEAVLNLASPPLTC